MSASIFTITSANQMLTERAAPLLRAYDDMVFQSDALAGLFDKSDTSEAATHVRTARIYMSEAAREIEVALADLRHQIAELYQLPASDLRGVAAMLKSGERA